MTIINPNSIAGITSVTAEAGVMNFYKSDGTLAGLQLNGVNFNTTAGVSTFNDVYVGGTITYEDVKNVDSVGIITARDGLKVLAGGANIVGVSTISNSELRITSGGAYTTHLNYSNVGTNYITSANGTGTYFRGSSNNVTSMVVLGSGQVDIESKIRHIGDTDTLMEFGTDTITFDTAGSERLRITSAGRVGINETSPDTDLHIKNTNPAIILEGTNGSGRQHKIWSAGTNSETLQITSGNYYNNADVHYFRATNESTVQARIDNTGIGIGGVTPARELHVHSSGSDSTYIVLTNGTTGTTTGDGFGIGLSGSEEAKLWNYENTPMIFATNSTERLRLTSAGLVKILGDGQNDGFYLSNAYGQAGFFGGMYYNGSAWVRAAAGTRKPAGMYVNTGGHIAFLTASETSGTSATVTESARITSAGNLLIGKTADSGKPLEVYQAGDAAIRIQNSASGTASNDGILLEIGSSSKDALIWNYESANMRFGTANNERLRIDSSGRVLIGTTVLGSTSADGLTVAASGNAGITVRSGTSNSGNLFFSDGNSGNSNFRGYVQYLHSSNALLFGTNAGERLRITSGGNVGINETSPDRALHVKSTTDTEQIYLENTASSGRAQVRFVNPHGDWVTGLIGGTTDGDFITYTSAAKNFRVYTNNSERLRIDSSGRLSIGLDSDTIGDATYYDDIVINNISGGSGAAGGAGIQILSNSSSWGGLIFGDQTSNCQVGYVKYDHGNDKLVWGANSSERMALDTITVSSTTSGVLGINDVTPAADALGLVVRNKGSQESALPVVLIQRDNNSGGGSSTDEIALKVNMPYTYNGAGDCYAIKSYAVHNLNSTHFAGHFEARGSQYDAGGDGAAVYGTIHKTDTNGPGYVPAFYAYARSTYNASSAGYAVGMRIKLNAYEPNVGILIHHELTNSNWTRMIAFRKGSGANGTEVGSIKSSNNATQYNTSSDYRLKENVVDLTGAITRLKQLKPKRFNFKNDTSKTVDGFLAHEVETSCPQAVSGTKDAVKIETVADPSTGKTIMLDDGTPKTETVIDPQEVDYSKLSTLTIAALQEALAKIEILEAKVAALEG